MPPNNKVCCKVIVRDSNSEKRRSIVGEIDKKQLISSDSNWITVYNAIATSRGLKSVFCVVPKSEISEIIVLKSTKRFVFDKINLTLNNTI